MEAKSDAGVNRGERAPSLQVWDISQLRLRRANREDVLPIPARLEDLLPPEHLARQVWEVVSHLDLSAFYAEIAVTRTSAGRPAIDPLILVAVWVYALSQGETEGRVVARLCVEHLAYIWLCGGVSVNHHSLSDFLGEHEEELDGLFTQVVVRLDGAGLVGWEAQAQDGMRVGASAGAASFHREPTLTKALAAAQAQVAALDPVAVTGPDGHPVPLPTPGEQAARFRADRERVSRLEAALAELPAVRAAKKTDPERREARVSSTDPVARVMKMPDGGYRPAYNWEFATDTAYLVIVGVDVVNSGSDMGQMEPMLEQELHRYERLPAQWLADGGFVNLRAIEKWSAYVDILTPVPTPKDKTRDPYVPLPTDPPGIAAWRERMGTKTAKTTYKLRAATAECVNAQARIQEGVQQSALRGLGKNRCWALWVALTHNLLIGIRELGTALNRWTLAPQAALA